MDSSQTPLKPLTPLHGRWKVLIHWSAETHKLVGGPAEVEGEASFAWIEGGRFLHGKLGGKRSLLNSDWIIGLDENSGKYCALYGDDRGVSRVYRMSFGKKVWRMWRDAPGFHQRFEGRIKGSRTISAYWERSADGKDWLHDFDITYSKVAKSL